MTPPTQETTWIGDALAQYEGPLLRYAGRLTGSFEQARDVVQDTFLRLCQADRQSLEDHLAEWLYTVCRNRAFELHRKNKRLQPMEDEKLLWHAAPGPTPDTQVERRDSAAFVWRVLDELPPNQQECVRLRYQGGMSYKAIAEVTGLTVTNVGFLLHTAVRALRDKLKEDAPDWPSPSLTATRTAPHTHGADNE